MLEFQAVFETAVQILGYFLTHLVCVIILLREWIVCCALQPGLMDDSQSTGSRRLRPRSDNSTASQDSPFFCVAPQRHWRGTQCSDSLHSNRGDLTVLSRVNSSDFCLVDIRMNSVCRCG